MNKSTIQDDNPLLAELLKIDGNTLKRLLTIWNIKKIPKDKKNQIKFLMHAMEDEFYVKGILEKLSGLQIQIYREIISSQDRMQTLGEIARKFNLPANAAEMELGVLKRYFLVYLRKNRERLTNSLDRYYAYSQSAGVINLNQKKPQELFQQTISDYIRRFTEEGKPDKIEPVWHVENLDEESKENILKNLIGKMDPVEEELVLNAFQQGGILEISVAREIIEKHKGSWEEYLQKLHRKLLLVDEFLLEEKFIRVLVMPADVFSYILKNPVIPSMPKSIKKSIEKTADNQLDFFINIKKTIAYILKRGITLSKAGKLKQTDIRDTENILLPVDIQLFKEKSQINQIELLLSVMRVLDIVRVKKDDVVLRNDWEEILKKDPLEILKKTLKAIEEAEDKLIRYEEVFEPVYVPFYRKKVFQVVAKTLLKYERIILYVLIGVLVRENIILSKNFSIREFPDTYAGYTKELVSVLFYMQLFGFLQVEYPDRWISFTKIGLHILKKEPLKKENMKGAVLVNQDLTMIAFPEKLSLHGIYLLKIFCELKSFENIYTFQLTRDSFHYALLVQEDPDAFLEFLKEVSPTDIPQNVVFHINEWKNNVPLVTITDECVVVKTREAHHMELLLGQISNKDIIIEQLSPNTIIIEQEGIPELIEIAEKLNLLVKLYR